MTAGRLARSYLFAPGNQERLLAKVFEAGADAVVLDLEDAVPTTEKRDARELIASALQVRQDQDRPAAWVRINPVRGREWKQDIAATVRPGLDGMRVPKVESAGELEALDEALGDAEEKAGLAVGTVRLTCTIESASGLLASRELAEHSRVDRLAFGSTDFMADIGADPAHEARSTLWARSFLVVVCRAGGILPPIAPVWTRLDDEDGLRRDTLECRQLGFFGRTCIHPRQIRPIHEIFTPSTEEIEEARHTLALHQAVDHAGGGVAVDKGGRFVDPAVLRRARAVLELAGELEVVPGGGSVQ